MAHIDVNPARAFNLFDFDLYPLLDGSSYVRSPYLFAVDYSDGYFDEFEGYGFTYDSYGLPYDGVVTSYSFGRDGVVWFEIDGFSDYAYDFFEPAFTADRSDDFELLSYILSGADLFDGSNYDDTVHAYAGNDELYGYDGADVLIGGTGSDILHGGANWSNQGDMLLGGPGDDVYFVDSSLDLVEEGVVFPEYGWGGFDTIISTADFFWDYYSAGESLVIDPTASDPEGDGTTAVGSVFANEMIGNAGTNILFGRGGSDIYYAGDGVDYISLSTLGLTDENAYVGVDGVNTVVVEPRIEGSFSYDIVFEFESGKDKLDVADYGYASAADVFARGFDDGLGNSYFALGDGFDYLYMAGLTLDELSAGDFIV